MKVALFIPCYVNKLYPQVAIATLELLEKLGCEVDYPMDQVCCGQPMANAGFAHFTEKCTKEFRSVFAGYEHVVVPSGSCTLHLKEHIGFEGQVWELIEFLTDVLGKTSWQGDFPFRVGYHASCHGLRGLRLAQMSELHAPDFSKPMHILKQLNGIELIELTRKDECCGFGGTFSVMEEAVSVRMGKDRLQDHERQKVAYITGVDVSCLMHLEGIAKRQKSPIRFIHVAEILNQTI